MSGIYIHIPYCKQACHYCDFHFSTNLKTKTELIEALLSEIEIRSEYLDGESIETIYFGGGTPSLLTIQEFDKIMAQISKHFKVDLRPEITLEANPDDLTLDKLNGIKSIGVNRLSIGIQSFNNDMLKFYNRAHDAQMAQRAVDDAQQIGLDNISVDLIFGAPNQTVAALEDDLNQVLALGTPHISIYGLTVEEKTVFGKWEKQHKLSQLEEEDAARHLEIIMQKLGDSGYDQYEISNFSHPGFQSQHNSSYWNGKKYLGIGPAAHSYNGNARQFNEASNIRYIRSLQNRKIPCTIEKLSKEDQINEYILTQFRLSKGIDCDRLQSQFGFDLPKIKESAISEFVSREMIETEGYFLRLTTKGKLLADFITEKLII